LGSGGAHFSPSESFVPASPTGGGGRITFFLSLSRKALRIATIHLEFSLRAFQAAMAISDSATAGRIRMEKKLTASTNTPLPSKAAHYKRDLLFIVESLLPLLDERRLVMVYCTVVACGLPVATL
jgi:hypothetical protein